MHQALYRKYRPRVFEDLVGQGHITQVLENQINQGQISHAYLFSGTRGTGKTSCAKIFARAVNCTSKSDKPCNKCDACLESIEESSVDIVEIDAASNNGVDNIRDIRDRAFYQPASLRYKVYIIDEVHMLSKGAFNALLKILEEPPDHLIFILATTEPERIPLTILSRCQKFSFNRIGPKIIENRLRQIAESESVEMDDRVYKVLVSRADGSMRDALSIMDQLFGSGLESIQYEDAVSILGIVSSDRLFDLVDSIVKSSSDWVDILDEILNTGKDIDQLGVDILDHFRKLMIAKVSKDSLDRYIFSNEEDYIGQAEDLSLDFITEAMSILINMIGDYRLSTQKRALLEIAIVKIISLNKNLQAEAKLPHKKDRPAEPRPSIESQPGPRPSNNNQMPRTSNIDQRKIQDQGQKRVTPPQNVQDDKVANSDSRKTTSLNLEQIQSDWKSILQEIKRGPYQLIHAFLLEASIVSFEGGELVLGFMPGYSFHRDRISEESNLSAVEKTLEMFYNENIKVKTCIINESNDELEDDIKNLEDILGDSLTIQ